MIRYGLPILALPAGNAESYRSPTRYQPPPRPNRVRGQHAFDLLRNLDALEAQIAEQRSIAPVGSSAIIAIDGRDLDANAAAAELSLAGRILTFDGQRDVAVLRVDDDGRALSRQVRQYRDQNTVKGNPVNRDLVDRIDRFRIATLADLSLGEIADEAIVADQLYWVEIWVPNSGDPDGAAFRDAESEIDALAMLVEEPDAVPVSRGPERNVYLVRITGELLRDIPSLLADVAVEVHIAQPARLVERAEQADYVGPAAYIGEPPIEANVVAVHDTGVRSRHPYLERALLGLDSAVPGRDGEDQDGHGSQMAGLAIYENLAASVSAGSVDPEHWFVSIRLLDESSDGGELWADRQTLAIELAESYGMGREVVHNVSIGAYNPRPGRRTSWSIALDKAAWNGGLGRLIVVAAGNAAPILARDLYPSANLAELHDQPGQAWNALTVGAVTALDSLTSEDLRSGAPSPLAAAGELSPYTTTGPPGNFPIKPEVAMEGGNSAPVAGLEGCGLQGLSLLTTGIRPRGLLDRAWATSASAAQASFALARLAAMHPGLRPATIRGLFVHSASWPTAAVAQLGEKRDIQRAIGFGQPDVARMGRSDSNRVVLLHEGEVVGAASSDQREAIFVRLPFPDFTELGLGEVDARLSVTLSYFVDPTDNLTRRDYAGARLRWDLQGPAEDEQRFVQRANAANRLENYKKGGPTSFDWIIGINARSRGTVQHDWVVAPGAVLGGERLLAIQPVYGWWSERIEYADSKLPFSVVVSVDLGEVDVDLHVEVENILSVSVDLDSS